MDKEKIKDLREDINKLCYKGVGDKDTAIINLAFSARVFIKICVLLMEEMARDESEKKPS